MRGDPYSSSDSASDDDSVVMTDAEAAEAVHELGELRRRWSSSDDGAFDWKLRVLGGAWTMLHRGVAADAVQAYVRDGCPALVFATQYHLGRSAKFDIALYGGMHGAMKMAHEFASKCQWCYHVWRRSGVPHFEFAAAVMAEYRPTEAFEALSGILVAPRALADARWLRALRPTET